MQNPDKRKQLALACKLKKDIAQEVDEMNWSH